MTRFLEEVPALQKLKLVFGLELRGRGDVQLYRVELPGTKVTKDFQGDERVRLLVPRADFNSLATEGTAKSWHKAFEVGPAKAEGSEQIIRLIGQVVEKHEERTRLRKASH